MNEQTEITMAGVAKGITYTSGAGAFLGGVSANDIASWLGIIGVIAGLAMQWYFNRRKDKRETAEHEVRMADYQSRQRGSVSRPLLGVVAALSVAVAVMVTPLVAKWEGVRYELCLALGQQAVGEGLQERHEGQARGSGQEHSDDTYPQPSPRRCKRPVSQCHRCDQRTHDHLRSVQIPRSAGS